MPPSDYLTSTGIEMALQHIATTFPTITSLISMPEKSIEGRTIRAVKIAKGTGPKRRGVLFIGGVHARELVNPDLLVSLALKLCQAYTGGTGLTFGGKTFEAGSIKLLVENMDIFFLPLVNPDGRSYVQSPTGEAMWRKNRNPNPGQPCKGVDLNRNYDFLFPSGIGTSTSSCSDVFKGKNAFSEPETRNVRFMLDNFPNILGMADVHSYSELILHPWGDDNNQTTNATMNFRNAAFDGLRGTTGDIVYKEFIPDSNLKFFEKTGINIREAIKAVRGRVYTAQQSVMLYPTSGTSKDYAYSRNFVNAAKRKVFAYTIETGTEFQPPYSEALNIISEVSAGLIQYIMACFCIAESLLASTALVADLDEMRSFRDEEMLSTAAGGRFVQMVEDNGIELMKIIAKDEKLRKQAIELVGQVNEVVRSRKASKPKVLSPELISAAEKLLKSFESKAGAGLKKALAEVKKDVKFFKGKTVTEGLKAASKVKK